MSTGKQAAVVGFVALAVSLMIFSYFRAFRAGPPPPPPEAGRKMEAAMKNLIAETQAREGAQPAALPGAGGNRASQGPARGRTPGSGQ